MNKFIRNSALALSMAAAGYSAQTPVEALPAVQAESYQLLSGSPVLQEVLRQAGVLTQSENSPIANITIEDHTWVTSVEGDELARMDKSDCSIGSLHGDPGNKDVEVYGTAIASTNDVYIIGISRGEAYSDMDARCSNGMPIAIAQSAMQQYEAK
jgi:hypothetical protein